MFLAPGLPVLRKTPTLLRRYFSLNSPVLFGVWCGEIRCAGSHCAFPTNRTMVRILAKTYQRGTSAQQSIPTGPVPNAQKTRELTTEDKEEHRGIHSSDLKNG